MGINKIIKAVLNRVSLFRKVTNYLSVRKFDELATWYERNENKWPDIQNNLLYELLLYAKTHSSYYKELITEPVTLSNCIDVLKSLPLLSKVIIKQQSERIYSDEVIVNNISWANTGGSTGEPLRFPRFEKGYSKEHICQMMLYHSMGFNSVKDLIITIDGSRIIQSDVEKCIYWKENSSNFPYGLYSLSTVHMSDLTLPYYIQFLNIKKPSIMRGYPSGFTELANFCKQNKIVWNFQLKGIYLTSENYGYQEEQLIHDVFKCPVWGQYGHTEASVFAVRKPGSYSYVTNPIYGYTEVLDETGHHVNKGQVGEIVVTGFNHLGVPFIRYKTGDLAEYGDTLVNGSVVLNELLGRSVDFVINSQNERIFLVGFIFGGHIKAFNHIRQWQLEQYEKGCVIMKILKGEGYNATIEKELIDLFKSKKLSVVINYTGGFEKTQRGKFKFLIQHIN